MPEVLQVTLGRFGIIANKTAARPFNEHDVFVRRIIELYDLERPLHPGMQASAEWHDLQHHIRELSHLHEALELLTHDGRASDQTVDHGFIEEERKFWRIVAAQ